MNILFSTNRFISTYYWLKFFEFALLFLYIVKTKPDVKTSIRLLLVAACASVLMEIGQFVKQSSIGGLFWFLGERTFNPQTPGIAKTAVNGVVLLRPYGTFPHPNVLAGFLITALMLIFLLKTAKSGKIPVLVARWTLIFGITLTFSRLTAVATLLFLSTRLIRQRLIALLILISIPVLFLLNFSFEDQSYVLRRDLSKAAWAMFVYNPVMGVGLGNFIPNLSKFSAVTRRLFFYQPAHSAPLLILAETGLLGAGFFILLSAFYLRSLWRLKTKDRRLRLLIVFSLFFLSLFDHYFLTLQQGSLTAVLALGLLLNT